MAADLVRQWNARAVTVTVADQGAVLAVGDAEPVTVSVPPEVAPREIGVDTCGAGDRFAGVVAAEFADGADPLQAVRAGVRDASRFVATGGATALNTEQHAIAQARPAGDLAALDLAEQVRRRGGRVVATGGCFDLLHPGHLTLLRRARELGDALVVCVNSDDSVRRLKGSTRPINTAADRVRMLLELGPVDSAVVFDETDPTALLSRLRPDVWVKGDEYADRPIPEAAVVRRYGGDVVFLPTVDGYSTTRLLQEVSARCWF
jgi:D-beta-D-heptose 7-phosphate kinase/D-beta-D-heptose 1-phosphate adenosyltransferase